MTQMIARIDSNESDVDILFVEDNEEIWKTVSAKVFMDEIDRICTAASPSIAKPRWIDDSILAISNTSALIRQKGHRRIVIYAGKAYEINFPNAIYLIHCSSSAIRRVNSYTYFDWLGKDTLLYNMPMPNMTGSESMCLGTADRHIEDGNILAALERIMHAEYTHDHVDNLKDRMSTLRWFEYLSKNRLKKHMLREQTPVIIGSLVTG